MTKELSREELKKMIIDYFKENPNTSAKPLIAKGDEMGGGVRGQIAGLVIVLRDSKILRVTGGFTNDVYLTAFEENIDES